MRLGDLDNLKEVINDMFMTGEYDCNSVLKAIDNASTVEAYPFEQVQELVKLNQQFAQEIENLKRPQGEWIMQRHDLDGCFYTCSNCGRMIRVSLFIDDPEDNETLADYPFCHCGAQMKGAIT